MGRMRKIRKDLAPAQTGLERWRRREGLSYGDMAALLKCSRQYVEVICKKGVREALRVIRITLITKGQLTMLDLLREEDRRLLIDDGYIPDPDLALKDPARPVTKIDDDHLV